MRAAVGIALVWHCNNSALSADLVKLVPTCRTLPMCAVECHSSS